MAFRFSLATVLRLRESIERREENALKKIQLEMARVSRQIDELNAKIAGAQVERDTELRQPMPAGHLQAMLAETQSTVETRDALQETLRELDLQRRKQLKVYQTAHRDHEMLIDMRNRQRDAYLQEQARLQQKYLDDIFIARHHRNEILPTRK
jgi:flagellar export protein FliJ